MTKTTWRSFNTPLSQIVNKDNYTKIETLLDNLTTELNKQLTNTQNINQSIQLNTIKSSGNFRDDYTKIVGKPHQKWTNVQGNKAKYQRMIIEQIRSNLLSLKDKQIITNICQKYNYDKNKFKEIREELTTLKLYPTNNYINNILQSKQYPKLTTSLKAQLNYTNGDKQIVQQNTILEKSLINSNIQVNGEWILLNIPIPKHLRNNTGHYSKPILQTNKNNEIIIRIAYEIIIENSNNNTYSMGIDLGKVKPFTAAINYNDGSYSTELTFTKELEKLNEKHKILNTELSRIYAKTKRIEKLLKGKENLYLLQHYNDLVEQSRLVKSKRTRLKDHASWLIARDIINHAVKHKVIEIKLEDLGWLASRGGKWDYSLTQAKIKEIAELNNIKVIIVDAWNSSHIDPFSDEYVDPDSDRFVKIGEDNLDRDFVASLELSRRFKKGLKKKNNKSRVLRKKSCRDKHSATPKRPKIIKRKQVLKNNKVFGVSITVASSTETRLQKTTSGSNTDHTMHNNYTQVLQL